jgi:hypothetical protein
VRAADDHDWSSNVDSLKKQGGKVSRHPHAPVGCGIAWKVTSMHTNRRAKFHVVRHRRWSKMAAPGYAAAGSCIRVDDSSGSIDDRSEASSC